MKNQNIIIEQGDLIESLKNKEVDCIAHQCNCFLISEECGG